jgi:riboflavin synthase
MFTGLIFNLATVARITGSDGVELVLQRPDGGGHIREGESIAVNGVCLTVKRAENAELAFDVVPETLSRSNLATLRPGDQVNFEPSLRAGDPIGGHIVYGHVDATCEILGKDPEGQGCRLWCATPAPVRRCIVEKGYVALDGVSVTVAHAGLGRFAVALIPETLKRTTLGRKNTGLSLNIEVDPVARYVAAYLEHSEHSART